MCRGVLLLLLCFVVFSTSARESDDEKLYRITDENDILGGLDLSLFHRYIPTVDPYSEATKYYRPQLSQRRRGLDWWVADEVVSPLLPIDGGLDRPENRRRARLYGSTEGYNIGASFNYAKRDDEGWSRYFDIDARTGRDLNIEGVFRQDLRAEVGISREFYDRHHLSISLNAPVLMRGLSSAVSEEVTTLTGENLYNPYWGLYDGKVRNSRVSKYAIPRLESHYQLPITQYTTLVTELTAEVGQRSISRLGWYDGYNPSPDYYRKLPSYAEAGELHNEVEQMWRESDVEYTQIAWDRLVAQNQMSSDGAAHYVVERQVVNRASSDMRLLLTTDAGGGVDLHYGVLAQVGRDRCFKAMDDMLGAEYLVDNDQYIGDYIHLNTQLQNDLRNPDRRVTVGERFGYDYTIRESDIAALLGVEYQRGYFSFALRGEFGERGVQRVGHYEKERFAGQLSYGGSQRVSMPSNRVDARVGYSPTESHHITLKGLYHQLPIEGQDLFIQPQSANRVVENPTSRTLSSVSVGYRFQSDDFELDVEGYLLYSSRETQTYSYYDDLSYTYSNVVVSNIGTRSVGLEVVSRWRVSPKLKWDVALSIGDYSYDTTPEVRLYNDQDLALTSRSTATAVSGCKVGNAPQLLATSALTYFVDWGWIVSLDCSYGGGRYVAPSFVRRTDRVVHYADSDEMAGQIIAQQRMEGVFDITPSLVRTLWLRGGDRLSLSLRVNNLLGASDRVEYGSESNRILTTQGGSEIGVRYLEPSRYSYSTPRTYYLSCSYVF